MAVTSQSFVVQGHVVPHMKALVYTGSGLEIQNCGCKITFMSSFGKFVGADFKILEA